ncbi:putative ER to Golgi transport-related protein [Papiliotrema laurentii]|uniref:ER to Golgi transport-related protein n=1 Tax=Papiliotrema laurentii TaxID=5418 RepID=A0AAD9CW98_PAPLA|nr:putative ER to Golgi transport-related protein [Papiliotrema laurentii]
MSFYLAIVSPSDSPLFELQFTTSRGTPTPTSAFPSWSSFTSSNGSDLGPPPGEGKIGGNLGLLAGTGSSPRSAGPGGAGGGERHMLQMIAHKSLDSVDEIMDSTGSLYLKNVDKHNEWTVSAFIAGNARLVLLHDVKNDDGIRLFFLDVWEAYVKVLLNPFNTATTIIRNPAFESKVRAAAKRHL